MPDVISSTIIGIEELFHSGFFSPAAVQRDFQWRQPQADQMLKDILDEMQAVQADDEAGVEQSADGVPVAGVEADATIDDDGAVDGVSLEAADEPEASGAFFLGSIILYPINDDMAAPSSAGSFEIFDGLQRLTTLSILIAVLRDMTKDADLRDRLHRLISDETTNHFRLTHRGEDLVLTQLVQPLGEAGKVRQQVSRPGGAAGQRIFDVTRQLRLSFSVKDQTRISSVAKFLLEHVRVSVVLIRNRRLARQTFVATNLYGVSLSRTDIFKGELLALARDREELVQAGLVWNKVVEIVSRNERVKNSSVVDGSRFEQFLMCCDMIERRRPQGVDCLGDLIAHLEKRTARGELPDWLASFEKLAEAWVELERVMSQPKTERSLDYHIWRLNFFKWQEWKPLALYWMARYLGKSPHGTTLWRFDMLSRRCMALTLLELDQAKRSEMFLEALQLAIRNRRPFDDSTRWLPLNFSKTFRDRIWDALGVAIDDYEVRRALMLWYEASLWGPGAPLYIRGASVEHVLPGRCGPKSQWLRDFPDAQGRYMAHASLGNLAMVDRQLQAPLANLDFAGKGGKKEQMGEAGQFDKYRSLRGVDEIDNWLTGVIQARTEVAARHVWGQLGLG